MNGPSYSEGGSQSNFCCHTDCMDEQLCGRDPGLLQQSASKRAPLTQLLLAVLDKDPCLWCICVALRLYGTVMHEHICEQKDEVGHYQHGLQEMDVYCSSSSGAVLLPQHYVPGSAPGGTAVLLGPLFPGQALTCQEGATSAQALLCVHAPDKGVPDYANLPSFARLNVCFPCKSNYLLANAMVAMRLWLSYLVAVEILLTHKALAMASAQGKGDGRAGAVLQSNCTVSFTELAVAEHIMCGPSIVLSCPLCNSTAAALNSTAAQNTPQQPYCNGTQHLMTSTGGFTDGSPDGGPYAPGSFCQWLIDPGYRYTLAHTRHLCTCSGPVRTASVSRAGSEWVECAMHSVWISSLTSVFRMAMTMCLLQASETEHHAFCHRAQF